MSAYPQYKKDPQCIHSSEVYGAAVFKNAARVTLNRSRKQKWLKLLKLEQQTLGRYLEYMKQTGQPVREPHLWRLKGRLDGIALGLMPWPWAMRMLRSATEPYQKRFLRLKAHAPASYGQFFDYIYAHEKAIESFASQELAGDPNSLADVDKLLEYAGQTTAPV